MKICFLSALYSDESYGGGVRTYLYYLGQELCQNGHGITIVTSGKPEEYYENNIHIIKIGEIEIFENKRQLFSLKFLYKRLRYMYRAMKIIKKYHFDIVEVPEGGFEHLFLAFNKSCPIVTRFHGNVNYTKFLTRPIRLVNILERLAVNKSDGLSSPTSGYASMLASDYRISSNTIKIIPYGIDSEFLLSHHAIDIRNKYGLKNKKIILFTGRLSLMKGVNLLYRAAEKLLGRPEITFVMIGVDTPYSNSLRFTANVLQFNNLSKDELFSFYKECDIFIMPSRFENMSYSILEAMVFGKAILGSDVGGIPELVANNYNGLLFKTGDMEDLISKLKYLLDNPNLLSAMGERSRELSKRYEIADIARSTIRFYEETGRKHSNS